MIDQYGSFAPNNEGTKWDTLARSQGHPFYGKVSLGNWTMFSIGMFWLSTPIVGIGWPALFVAIEGHGAYTFSAWAHWRYVSEKLDLVESDARNMADLINQQLGETHVDLQGKYENLS